MGGCWLMMGAVELEMHVVGGKAAPWLLHTL